MAKYGSGDVAFFLVDGYDLKGDQTDFSLQVGAMFEETHGLGDSWREQLPTGVRTADMSQSGFFDDATDAVNAALSEQQATSRIVMFGVAGNVVGRKFTGLRGAYASTYARTASRNQLHKASATYKVSGQVDEGVILQEDEVKTVDWNNEGADSASSATRTANGAQELSVAGTVNRHLAFDGNVTGAGTIQAVAGFARG